MNNTDKYEFKFFTSRQEIDMIRLRILDLLSEYPNFDEVPLSVVHSTILSIAVGDIIHILLDTIYGE